ncbi:MAG TPA: Mu-like prophage major head subunit gpT family protein [Armatimonadota bacterium]|nr:Mu-like prophage major head subunit gpT family protein [Armatimonadota bacterium]
MPETPTIVKPNQAIQFFMPLSAARAATEAEGGGVWLHIMPIGSWKAPWQFMGLEIYEITPDAISQIVRNFDANVLGIEIAVDENHQRGPAPGWIKALRAEADGLWARIEWTALGDDLVGKKLYAYGSPSWYDAAILPYQDPTTGEKVPWVLEGYGLTNKPFFSELAAVAETRQDGILVCTAANFDDRGDRPMPDPKKPPAGEQQDPKPNTDDSAALRAERDAAVARAATAEANTTRLEAEQATARREKSLADITARFAAVRQGRSQLSEAHAQRLAEAAMDIPDDKREAHVTAQIEAMEKGMVPQGEMGGASPAHVVSGGISPALVATARRLGLDPAFVFAAANRGPGGALDIEGARAGVGRIAPLTASVEMPSLSYQETMVLIEGFFVAGYESTPALTTDFANRVVSNQRTIDYRALGAPPRMREWLDEIQGAVLNTLAEFPVTVRDWEATLEIPVSELQADKLGQYAMRIQQMGAFAKQHPDELLAALIAAAETTLCYDGQYICDTDHSEGSSGAQSNFLTTGYDDDDIADISLSLGAAVAAFNGFKDDRGQYLRIGSRPDAVFDVLVRPAVLHLFRTLATADVISSTSNGWKGRIRPMALPELTVASDFYVAYTEGPVKPFIAQYQNEPSALKTLGPDSEHAQKNGRAWFSTQGNYTVAPGDWRYLIKLQKA